MPPLLMHSPTARGRDSSMFVTGLDIATVCGGADGAPGTRPRTWTWDLHDAGKRRADKLALLQALCERYFRENKVDAFFYESGMTLGVAYRVGTADPVFALLRGAIGVVEACAGRAKIPRIEAIGVQEARKHLVGQRSFAKGKSKEIVFQHCRMLGYAPTNHDEADAIAIWSTGCAMVNPRIAHLSTGLFGINR